jgi:hypothetical protein
MPISHDLQLFIKELEMYVCIFSEKRERIQVYISTDLFANGITQPIQKKHDAPTFQII